MKTADASPPAPAAAVVGLTSPTPSAPVTAAAWITTLLISRLPEIILLEVFGLSLLWMPWAVLALTAALWVASRFAPVLRPLSAYFAVMTAVAALLALIPVIFQSAAWQSFSPPTGHPIAVLLAERILLAALAFVMIGVVVLLGTRPRDAYLGVGDLRAPTTSRKPGSTELLRWSTFGPIMILFLAFVTAWAAAPLLRGPIDVAAALPYLGLAAIAALLNAFWEEVAYRAAPLSQLGRAVTPATSVLILAVWFGLGHYYGGIPSGLMGAVLTGAVALLFGRAMIETRGLAWPLALHFTGDLVIYVFLALGATAAAGAGNFAWLMPM
jgi:membrane protease YdiL (CAAX protease family)